MTESTDLIILKARDMRIAARVRRAGFYRKYPNDFTVRFGRLDSGVKTEMAKIMEGFGDWMVYAHAEDSLSDKIVAWMIIDLESFRHHCNKNYDKISYEQHLNADGRTHFLAFDAASFPADPPLIVARSSDALVTT